MIDRSNVINWSIDYTDGKEQVQHATIRQFRQRSVPGSFGVVLDAVYHVLRPNLVETYRLEKKGREWVQIKDGKLILPVVRSSGMEQLIHTLLAVTPAEINRAVDQHFQMRSDLQELLHKCHACTGCPGAKIGLMETSSPGSGLPASILMQRWQV